MKTIPHRRQFIALFVLIGLAVLVYGNTLHAPFYLDDDVNIVENPYVRLTGLGFQKLVRAGFESPCPNRPVANITFGLNYFFGHYNPTGYRIFNILLHIANGILLYFFARTSLRVSSQHFEYGPPGALAFFTALVWLVHPLQTQSVTYVVQRMNSLATFFYLISLLSYIKGRLAAEGNRRWPWFLSSIAAWILALGSKEIAASLPFLMLVYEWFFFRHGRPSWLRPNFKLLVCCLLGIGLAVLAYTDFAPLQAILSGYTHRNFTPVQRVLTQFRVVAYYVGLIIYPHPSRLSLLHDFEISRSLGDPPTTMICAAAIAASLYIAYRLTKKEPLLAFCILWFLGNLMIESSLVSLEIIFEHRTYLPSMLFWLLVVALLYRYLKHPKLAVCLLCVAATTFSWWTYQRNTLWSDELAFWRDCTKKTQDNVRAYHSLGNAFLKSAAFDDAVKAYEKAMTIDPTYVKSLLGLGDALRQKGDLLGAVAIHKKAIKVAPNNGTCYNHLGTDYIKQNRMGLALEVLKKATALSPHDYRAHNNLGFVYAKTGNVSEALRMYQQAITIRPDFALAYNNLGTLFLNPSALQQAIVFFRKALQYDPKLADAHSNMGLALIHKGYVEQGIRHIESALRLEPDHQDATFNLARALELTGNFKEAIEKYEKIIRFNPKDAEAHFNAGFIYLNHLTNAEQAIVLFKEGLLVNPSHQEAKTVRDIIFKLENSNQKDA